MFSLIKKLLGLVIVIIAIATIVDYLVVMRFDKDPWFTFKEEHNIKYGLIYKIKNVDNINEFYIFNFKIDEKEITSIEKEFEVIDKTGNICKEIKTYFYEDGSNKYYFDCMKEYYIKINGIEYTLKNALENNLITLNDLDKKNLEYKVESK